MSSNNSNISSTISKEKKELISVLNESVHTSDNIDIGDTYGISRNFIIVKRGFINIHYYYIPIKHVEGWDGNRIWLKISESTVMEKYEREKLPDPNQYYINNYPYYCGFAGSDYYLQVIPPKYTQKSDQQRKFEPQKKVHKLYSCAFVRSHF